MQKRRVLVVIDVQNSIFELPIPTYEAGRFLDNVVTLINHARNADIPIVFVQHCGSACGPFERGTRGWELHPRLEKRAHETVIEKSHPDGFQDSKLESTLVDRRAEEMVFCGFATQLCFDTTVRAAYSKGFNSVVVSDAHTTTDNDVLPAEKIIAHHNFVLSRFARVVSTQEFMNSRILEFANS